MSGSQITPVSKSGVVSGLRRILAMWSFLRLMPLMFTFFAATNILSESSHKLAELLYKFG